MTARGTPRPCPTHRPALMVLLLAAGAAHSWCAAPRPATAGPKDRRLANTRVGISIEAPAGWTFSQHTGYADTVALLVHPDGSRVSVAAAATTARTAGALVEQNRPGMVAQGLVASGLSPGPRESLQVDLSAPKRVNRDERVRQLYLVRNIPAGRQAVVLTLACRANAFAARTPALEFIIARMTWEDPIPGPDVSPTGAGGSAAATTATGR